ncbi:MAG: AraC family transcriptional regulator [Clostridia bacterium]|nr:AraC family transcriptional regulator [Clostridia bacterium]
MPMDRAASSKRESNLKGKPFPFEVVHIGEPAHNMKYFHWHDFLEISYIDGGSGTYHIEGKTLPVKKGDIVIINNIEKHMVTYGPDETLYETVIHFDPSLIWSEENSPFDHSYLRLFLYNGARFNNKPIFNEKNTAAVKTIISEIVGEYTRREQFFELMIKAKLLTLITLLIRQCFLEESSLHEFSFKKKNIERLDRIILYVNEHYDKELRLPIVAKEFYMNASYFSEFFKKNMGVSFSDYLTMVRINKALSLLYSENLSTTEIAFRCGFNNLSSFFSSFKKCTGMNPGEYKKAEKSL